MIKINKIFVAFVVSILSLSTAWADNVARIGSTDYATLQDAIDACPDNTQTTITMTADMNTAGNILFEAGKNIVLDLNGKTISCLNSEKEFYFIRNYGILEITDNSGATPGKITFKTTDPDKGYGVQNVTIYNENGTLTLTNGTIENTTTAGLAYAVVNSSNAWGHSVTSTFNMTGGTISAPQGDAALRVYQNTAAVSNILSHNYVNISGGTIADTGIFCDTFLYTQGHDLTNYTGANIETRINITGGTVNGLIDMKIRHPYTTILNISDGSFNNTRLRVRKHATEYAISEEPNSPMVYISGGNFNFAGTDFETASWTSYNNAYEITGGTFSIDPTTYVAAGYAVTGNYTVGLAPVAQIGNVKYASLAEAVAAVPADGTPTTITMIADEQIVGNVGVTIAKNQNVVLDLNGHVLSQVGPMAAAGYLLRNQGTLTVKDNTDTAKNGTGNGKMLTSSANPDTGSIPSYANNLISNYGTLNIESGYFQSLTNAGYASFVVDNYSGGTANISGGKLCNTAPRAYVVRMFLNSTTAVNELNISGTAEITGSYSVWLQYANGNANKASLNISGGTMNATDGFAVYGGGGTRNSTEVSINITGGTINGTGAWFGTDTEFKSFSVSGGTFAGLGAGPAGGNHFITGGKYWSISLFDQLRTEETPIIAEGYEAVQITENNETYWLVGKKNITFNGSTTEGVYTGTSTKQVQDEDENVLYQTSVVVTVQGNNDAEATIAETSAEQLAINSFVETVMENVSLEPNVDNTVKVNLTVVAENQTSTAETLTYEVHPVANVTVNDVPASSFVVANEDLADNAEFTFQLSVASLNANEGDLVKVVHKSADFEDETFVCTVDANQKVTITTSHFSEFELSLQSATVNVAVSKFGMSTYCSDVDLDFTGSTVAAYVALEGSAHNYSENELYLTRVYKVKAGTGILLQGTQGEHAVAVATSEVAAVEGNMLVGVLANTNISATVDNYTNFFLTDNTPDGSGAQSDFGFYEIEGSKEIPANRAYLQLANVNVEKLQAQTAKGVFFVFGDATGINSVDAATVNSVVYDLQGRRVANPTRGLYIVNGKKVVLK